MQTMVTAVPLALPEWAAATPPQKKEKGTVIKFSLK